MNLKNIFKNKRNQLYFLILLILICFLIRFHNAGALSGGDDSGYAEWIYYAIEDPSRFIYFELPDEPIYYQGFHDLRNFSIIPLAPFVYLFGFNMFALRLAPLLFACLSAFLLYAILKKYFNIEIAFLATFFFVFSPLHIAFTRVVFVDSALTFYVLLTIFLVTKGIEEKKNYLIYIAGGVVLIDLLTTNFRGAVPLLCLIPFALLSKPTKKQWMHLIIVGLSIPVLYLSYAALPILWSDYAFFNSLMYRFFHSGLGKAVNRDFSGFIDGIIFLVKYMYFTVFVGLIIIPAIFGIKDTIKKIKIPINALLMTYLLTSLVFLFQGYPSPSRQTFYTPVLAAFAAIGIVIAWESREKIVRSITLILSALLYFIVMMLVNLNYIPETIGYKTILIDHMGSALFNLFTLFSIISILVLCLLIFFISFNKRIKNRIKKIHKGFMSRTISFIFIIFLLINVFVPAVLVIKGVGIYHRSEAINEVADYLKNNLGDEKYACVAGVHEKTLTFLLQRPNAYWLIVDKDWLEENAQAGNIRYFLINHEFGTVGLGPILPDGSIDDTKNHAWWTFQEDKWNWLMENTVDITEETGLEKENPYLQLRELK